VVAAVADRHSGFLLGALLPSWERPCVGSALEFMTPGVYQFAAYDGRESGREAAPRWKAGECVVTTVPELQLTHLDTRCQGARRTHGQDHIRPAGWVSAGR
jgi:hypothetical protein